jgi:hypothetical protein
MKTTAIVLAIIGAAVIAGGIAAGSREAFEYIVAGCIPAGIAVLFAIMADTRESRKS